MNVYAHVHALYVYYRAELRILNLSIAWEGVWGSWEMDDVCAE